MQTNEKNKQCTKMCTFQMSKQQDLMVRSLYMCTDYHLNVHVY